MKDIIIVGRGLAAHVLAHSCHQKGLRFMLIGDPSLSQCSRVAAGIWNPIVFKRLTKSWMADSLIPHLEKFYTHCEDTLGKKITTSRTFIRPFSEEQEKALWLKRGANELDEFIERKIHETKPAELQGVHLPLGYSHVLKTGNLHVPEFLEASDKFFGESVVNEVFDHGQLQILNGRVRYQQHKAKAIVFCEGYKVKDSPFFRFIPLKPVKGEVLDVRIDDLHLKNTIINKGAFIMDTAPQHYRVGASYNWEMLNDELSEEGRDDLISKLKQITSLPYTVLNHKAGVRPSSIDRRPVLGQHPKHPELFIFNGLGTKGVMLAPYFADKFVLFLLQKQALPAEVDVKRHYHLYNG